jgi:hypothetical protein
MKFLTRHSFMPGPGVSLRNTADGIVVDCAGHNPWKHPWFMTPTYLIDEETGDGRWHVYVNPGYVNGGDVMVEDTPIDAETPAPLKLTAWRDVVSPGGITLDADGNLRAQPGEGYPKFFEKLFVAPPSEGGDPTSEELVVEDPNRTRLLRATDVILRTARIATQNEVTVLDPLTDSQSVIIATTFNSAYYSSVHRHRLLNVTKHIITPEPTLLDRMLGLAVEPQNDDVKIATIYALSPPFATQEDEVGPDWGLYPKYDPEYGFWNLSYATKNIPPGVPNEPLRLQTGLAGGVGDTLINFLLSPVNDGFERVMAFLGAADYGGRYWTV